MAKSVIISCCGVDNPAVCPSETPRLSKQVVQ